MKKLMVFMIVSLLFMVGSAIPALAADQIDIASTGGTITLTQVTDQKKADGKSLFIAHSGAKITFKSKQPTVGGRHILYKGESSVAYYPDAVSAGEGLQLGERAEVTKLSDATYSLKPGAHVFELTIVERVDDGYEKGDFLATMEHFTVHILPEAYGKETVKPTSATVVVDGKQTAFEAYTIGGNNYFKLRDLAMVVSGTAKQFEVAWNGEKQTIELTKGQAYTPVGGELALSKTGKKQATRTVSTIYLDGQKAGFASYTINGNNYFMLRDIARAFDIGVTWDAAKQQVGIQTNTSYVEEGQKAVSEASQMLYLSGGDFMTGIEIAIWSADGKQRYSQVKITDEEHMDPYAFNYLVAMTYPKNAGHELLVEFVDAPSNILALSVTQSYRQDGDGEYLYDRYTLRRGEMAKMDTTLKTQFYDEGNRPTIVGTVGSKSQPISLTAIY